MTPINVSFPQEILLEQACVQVWPVATVSPIYLYNIEAFDWV